MSRNEDLDRLLADYQVLYQKLRGFHWNVRGPMFFDLHAKFEELYLETAERVDAIAERISALGGRPASTLAGVLETARLKEEANKITAIDMVKQIIADYGSLGTHLRKAAADAEKAGDVGTENLLETMADAQEKTAWMLKSYLG